MFFSNIIDYMAANKSVAGVILLLIAVITVAMVVALVYNILQTDKLKKKYISFMSGADGESLEKQVRNHIDTIDKLVDNARRNRSDIDALRSQITLSFQKIGMVKYDAFQEMGGKLSFTLAMLNERDDGYIINSMHSREGSYTYIKEVVAGECVIKLAEEEEEALKRAIEYK